MKTRKKKTTQTERKQLRQQVPTKYALNYINVNGINTSFKRKTSSDQRKVTINCLYHTLNRRTK